MVLLLPAFGVPAASPHLYCQVKSLEIGDHGWIGAGHIYKKASIRKQLLVQQPEVARL
jgi:hypothetical protein